MSQEIGLAEGHLPHNERTVLYMGKTQLGLSSTSAQSPPTPKKQSWWKALTSRVKAIWRRPR